MIKDWIRNWLGITDIVTNQQQLYTEHSILHTKMDNHKNQLRAVSRQLDTIGPGLGRVIAKLDAKYAESEFDPTRRAESDKLAEETIKRLEAEAAARAPYNDQQ